MYTHCPHCDTCFRVTSEQLKTARGSVRCGRCFGTFSALENLVDEPPQPQTVPPALTAAAKKEPPTPKPNAKPAVKHEPPAPAAATPKLRPALIDTATATPSPAPPAEAAKEPPAPVPTTLLSTPKSAPTLDSAEVKAAVADTSSSPAPAPFEEAVVEQLIAQPTPIHQPIHQKTWLWVLSATVLALVLTLQYAWFNLNTLAQQSSLRPTLQTLCNVLGCEVPLIKAPNMIALIERNIRNHPKNRQILQVKARIINKASEPQEYPVMELSLHDITGKALATRRFTPNEYLAKEIDQKQGMVPQQPVDIMLELSDPGKAAVGFEFEFF